MRDYGWVVTPWRYFMRKGLVCFCLPFAPPRPIDAVMRRRPAFQVSHTRVRLHTCNHTGACSHSWTSVSCRKLNREFILLGPWVAPSTPVKSRHSTPFSLTPWRSCSPPRMSAPKCPVAPTVSIGCIPRSSRGAASRASPAWWLYDCLRLPSQMTGGRRRATAARKRLRNEEEPPLLPWFLAMLSVQPLCVSEPCR